MSVIKCFGCSFTRHGAKNWPTWVDFLRLSAKNTSVQNFGLAGSSNEYICRQIIKNAIQNDTVIVMWSGFDRTHSEIFFQKNKHNEGCEKYPQKIGLTYKQLYERTLEYIWLANRYCESKSIKIINLSMTLLHLGETGQINHFEDHLKVDYKNWPFDLSSFCVSNKSMVEIKTDRHPSPSQQYKYLREIISPLLGIEPIKIDNTKLYELDSKARKEVDGQ